jgi:hypothetical protein
MESMDLDIQDYYSHPTYDVHIGSTLGELEFVEDDEGTRGTDSKE